MEVRFANADLDRIETDPDFDGGHGVAVVRAFRKVVNIVRNAVDERDLYKMNSLRFKKLEGSRSHQRSLRLNDQWRLIVEIQSSSPKNVVVVVSIEDYH